jgi:hypothetical protein
MRAGWVAVTGFMLVAGSAAAEPIGAGSTLAPFTAEDQHGARVEVDERVRLLVFSRDMDGGDVVKQALADTSQASLDGRHAVYVADISRMPAVISTLIAVPRMRQRPYRVLLDRDGSSTRDLPYEKGRPTVLVLDALRVVRVEHPGSADALRAALAGAPPP